jgi:site-specific recombinase XerD
MATIYATGLRCDELCKLKVPDIDSQRMIIVRAGKGGIPRQIQLSPALRERLRVYYRWGNPTNWLFPSTMRPTEPLQDKTVRVLCLQAGRRAAIPFTVHPHLFRHACGTRMLDAGADLHTIQVLLGHADIRTNLQPIDDSDDPARQR